ncbi:MAG: hypothetical protein NXI32_14790 [bacterium]|nr:hypothetical protein [bacterium]
MLGTSKFVLSMRQVMDRASRQIGMPHVPDQRCLRRKRTAWHYLLGMLALTLLCGCRGCVSNNEELTREELEKRAQERRESLEMSELISLPADSETKLLTVKPGHWHETVQSFKSNREDLQVVALGGITRGSDSVEIPGTNFVNEFTRRTSLPKGQTKTVDLQCFVPFSGKQSDPFAMVSNRLTFRTELLNWPLMSPILQSPSLKPANELNEHEFQLVALSPEALSYEFLTVLDAVYWNSEDLLSDMQTRSYYVSLVKPQNNRYLFPQSLLTMTSIAVVVWDDVAPDELSANQKNALLDWVHWGGQLVISGPSSWARLRNSFLSPYLPATEAQAIELNASDFAPISETWMVEDLNRLNTPAPIEFEGTPLSGLRYELNSEASWLPKSGELVAERQVGRGRIVMTSFPLNEPRLYRWRYFSSFFSTGLLRRHPRMVRRSIEDQSLSQFWTKPYQNSQHDPRMHSNVRILTRDLPLAASGQVQAPTAGVDMNLAAGQPAENDESSQLPPPAFTSIQSGGLNAPDEQFPATEAMQWGGRGAAWNDYSGLTLRALQALKAAAGIELPSKKTILYLLAGYLACLVPLNWLVFKLLGRLEFAWIAAPIMALIGVLVVTRVARLDIGFARRTTEISVLELHGSYPRGHLTQYLALYTSLSTNYAIDFPENDSVALPLGDLTRSFRRATSERRNVRTNFGRSEGVTLEPLTVYSNSTEMIHAEQIIGLEGGLRLGARNAEGDGQPALRNETGLGLQGVLVMRRTPERLLEAAWVGDLSSGQTANLDFDPTSEDQLMQPWQTDPITQSDKPVNQLEESSETDALWVGGVLAELVQKTPLMPGQTRLFAYTNDRLSQLTLSPEEDQFDGRCLVVAHLTPQRLGDVLPDLNIRSRKSSSQIDASNKEELDEELKRFRPNAGDATGQSDASSTGGDTEDPK